MLHEMEFRAMMWCDDADDDKHSEVSTADSSGDGAPARGCRHGLSVSFRDFDLAEVIEVEPLKDDTRFTIMDRARAERQWRSDVLQQLRGARSAAEKREALGRVQGALVELATAAPENDGSLAVQQAMEMSSLIDRVELIGELHGFVPQLLSSRHGGKVLLSCLRVLPKASEFIAHEITGNALVSLQLPDGAEVVGQLLRCLPRAELGPLIDELLGILEEVCWGGHERQIVGGLLQAGALRDREQMYKTLTQQARKMEGEARIILEGQLSALATSP